MMRASSLGYSSCYKGKCVTRYDYIKTGLSDRYNAIEVYVVCGTKVSRLLL